MRRQTLSATRRNFIKTSSAAALGLTVAHPRVFGNSSPSNRVVLGFIGVGGRGTELLNQSLKHDDVSVAALCDVDRNNLDRAIRIVKEGRDQSPTGYKDFRNLLERDDMDAVVIATPDHWHALPFVAACERGKDIFIEKPLSHNLHEGRVMLEAAEKHNRITQLGTIIHNDYPNYRQVVEIIRSGKLGGITRVHCWKTARSKGCGYPRDCPPPPELDYDFWLGPAPKRPYNPNRSHWNFRYFWDYAGGIFADFWCHIADVAFWALDLTAPKSVSAIGGRFAIRDNTETPDCLEIIYEFPGLNFTFTVCPGPSPVFPHMGGIGCAFQGTKATLVTDYTRHEIYVKGKKADDPKLSGLSIPPSPGHMREFLDSIKSRATTTCNIAYAHRLTKSAHLGNISYRVGRKIIWDDTKEEIVGDSQANHLLSRKYRKPWKLT